MFRSAIKWLMLTCGIIDDEAEVPICRYACIQLFQERVHSCCCCGVHNTPLILHSCRWLQWHEMLPHSSQQSSRKQIIACKALRPLAASDSRPSTVVMVPFCVAVGISSSISGTVADALSDFTTCHASRTDNGKQGPLP